MTTLDDLMQSSSLDAIDTKALLKGLLQQHLGWHSSQLITRHKDLLPEPFVSIWHDAHMRRASGEPVAYILGYKEFFNITLKTGPQVLIPRPETELLVEIALDYLQTLDEPGPRVLDLGTGSGAIALAIAKNFPSAAVVGLDRSPDALTVAKENARELNIDSCQFIESDWFSALDSQQKTFFDVIVSNPPYIKRDDPHLSQGDLRYEPTHALTDHSDGLSAYRTIAQHAKDYIKPDGLLLLEHGHDQSDAIGEILRHQGWNHIEFHRDLAGHLRAISAKLS